MRWKQLLPIVLLVLVFILWVGKPFYILQEENQVVVTRFGNIVRVHKDSGLKVKVPFLEQLTTYTQRLQVYDSAPDTALTSDKRRLNVDFFVTYRIRDPKLYKEKVRTIRTAQTRLDDILYSNLRNVISEHSFSDNIVYREAVVQKAMALSQKTLSNFGIEVSDVQIELLNLPQANEESVFTRMRSERNRIAAQYESEGESEAQIIKAQAEREAEQLLADAQREAEEIRGEGDQERTRIYAEAYMDDPEFYAFWKGLDSLKEAIPKSQTTVLLPLSSPLAQLLAGEGSTPSL